MTALGEYIDAERASLIPSATAVADYPPKPYGVIGLGPQPAKLDALLVMDVEIPTLDDVIVQLFNIDSAFPVQLKRNGELWPALRCSLASLFMYYPERVEREEMVAVQHRLLEVVQQNFHCEDPDTRIRQWAVAIRKKFDLDNLENVTGPDGGNQAAVVNLMQDMHSSVMKQNAVLDRVCSKLAELDKKQDHLRETVLLLGNQRLEHSPRPDLPGSEVGSEFETASLSAVSRIEQSPAPSASSAASSSPISSSSSSLIVSSPPVNALTQLRGYKNVNSIPKPYSLAGITCADFFLDYANSKFVMPLFKTSTGLNCSASGKRARLVVQYFEWMMTDDELARIRDPEVDKGELRVLFPKIEGLFLAFVADLFKKTGSVPKILTIGKKSRARILSLSPSGLEERLKELKRRDKNFNEHHLNREIFQTFRRKMEPQLYEEIMGSGNERKRLKLTD